MDFYNVDMSGPCRAVCLTAKAVGVTLNKKELDLFADEHLKPEFLAINPQHCIPTLVDGDLKLWESRAICTYLVSQYGKDDSLYPKDPKVKVLVDRLLYFDMGMYGKYADYMYPAAFGGMDIDPKKLDPLNEALGWLNGYYLEGHDFAIGNNMTVADFCLIASVSSFIESGIDISKFPNITAWVERCKSQMSGYESENGVGAKKFGEYCKSQLAKK